MCGHLAYLTEQTEAWLMIEIHLAGDEQRSYLVERIAYSKRTNNMSYSENTWSLQVLE